MNVIWQDPQGNDGELETDDAAPVKELVAEMDDDRMSMLICTKGDGVSQLIIGGNPDQGFVVSYTDDQRHFFVQRHPDGVEGGSVWVVTGGQSADFPSTQVVDLAACRQAVDWWFGSLAADVVWEPA